MDVRQKILVLDDDRQIARLVQQYLTQAGFTVLMAYDGAIAVQMLNRDNPNFLVLDLGLPDRDEWDITRQIRANPRWAKLPIIMLTARIDDMDKVLGLELGANDYITKPFNAREVVARVRPLLRRVDMERAIPEHLLQVEELTLDRHKSSLEFALMELFMQYPNSTFNREELLERTLGYSYEGMGRTLDTHIK